MLIGASFFLIWVYIFKTLKIISPVVVFFLVVQAITCLGQKQLVLLKGETVMLRLRAGDDFVFRLKGSKDKRVSYVNNLLPGAVVTHRDTVPFDKIERIYFRKSRFYNRLGGALVVFGVGLFLIDQINTTLIQGEDASLDQGVTTFCMSAVGVGLPMMLIKKKSQRITYKYRLLTVDKNSVFYLPDPNANFSPFQDN